MRTDGTSEFVFLQNYNATAQTVELGAEPLTDMLAGGEVSGPVRLAGYGCRVLRRPALQQPRAAQSS
ncbi:MAG: Beta-galactosidase C-terminal domain [Kiritimatiellae bacterium]|nr:Beta-galactosidase C-terminal domain [Kiritimatiellia bacterium]